MKQSPEMQKLDQMLRSSRLVDGGFMGNDHRSVNEVIEEDIAFLEKAGVTPKRIAERMQEITDQATRSLGVEVFISEKLSARVEEAKGSLVCPWPHAGKFAKRVTIVTDRDTGDSIQFSDLGIHLISEHVFFQGKGSRFRLEPKQLLDIMFQT